MGVMTVTCELLDLQSAAVGRPSRLQRVHAPSKRSATPARHARVRARVPARGRPPFAAAPDDELRFALAHGEVVAQWAVPRSMAVETL